MERCLTYAKKSLRAQIRMFSLFQILVSVLDKFTNEMKVGDTKSAVRKVFFDEIPI